MKRSTFIGVPDFYNLNLACAAIHSAFGTPPYLVGSSLERRDYRDVDVRVILADDEYERLFPGLKGNPQINALWSLMCCSVSEWLASRTGLPIDFQIQQMTEANREHQGRRNALGLFVGVTPVGVSASSPRPADDESPCPNGQHKWVGRQMGGSPDAVESYEWVEYCDICGVEHTGD